MRKLFPIAFLIASTIAMMGQTTAPATQPATTRPGAVVQFEKLAKEMPGPYRTVKAGEAEKVKAAREEWVLKQTKGKKVQVKLSPIDYVGKLAPDGAVSWIYRGRFSSGAEFSCEMVGKLRKGDEDSPSLTVEGDAYKVISRDADYVVYLSNVVIVK